ncbi:MAG TPA: acyl-CoA dehydrogenase [Gammaproteobacteria bacterium]|nr:acyl-CoA dehydrogenase [Gammaproteobacteria bacterium]
MIELEIPQNLKNIRDMLHGLMKSKVRPLCLQADIDGKYPESFYDEIAPMMSGMSLGGGGGGGGKKGGGMSEAAGMKNMALMAIVAGEEIGWGDPTFALNMPGPGTGGPALAARGTPEQKEKYFGMLEGKGAKWAAYGLTEPGAGSDVANIKTNCRKEGNEWVINGRKCFISNGAKAEWTIVFATVDPKLGHAGQRVFVVEKDTPGLTIGKIENKLGFRASETAEMIFEECRVPAENLVGGEAAYEGKDKAKEGFKTAMQFFDTSRPMVGIMGVGIGRAAYEELEAWIKDNYWLSRPIPRYAAIRDRLFEMQQKLEAARLLCWKAAWMADNGIANTKEASMSKMYGPGIAMEVCSEAVDIMGTHGSLAGTIVDKCYRDIKVFDIFEGTHQIQQTVIAKHLFDRVPMTTG